MLGISRTKEAGVTPFLKVRVAGCTRGECPLFYIRSHTETPAARGVVPIPPQLQQPARYLLHHLHDSCENGTCSDSDLHRVIM
jgi:hypothetical protein